MPPGLPACAQVDLSAIRGNVATLKERAGSAEVMAVVKADAYGHGLLPSARAALAGGATWLGVAQLPEAGRAAQGRGRGYPVLSWLHVPGQDFTEAVRLGIDLSVSSQWALDAIAATARREGLAARIHLKVDTGLGRGAWARRSTGSSPRPPRSSRRVRSPWSGCSRTSPTPTRRGTRP